MSDITKNLKQATGYNWQEINDVYLKFRLKHSKKIGQMCVFTPDDLKKARARLFLPEQAQGLDVHKPDVFLKKYLNARQQIVKNMPWVQVDLANFPAKPIYYGYPDGTTLVGKLTFSGNMTLRPKQSSNDLVLGQHTLRTISEKAKLETISILRENFSVNFDMKTKQLSININGVEDDIVTSLTVNYPSVTAQITDRQLRFTYHGWDVILNLSLLFEGEISHNPPTKELVTNNEFWHVAKVVGIGALIALGITALVIFTGGSGIMALVAV